MPTRALHVGVVLFVAVAAVVLSHRAFASTPDAPSTALRWEAQIRSYEEADRFTAPPQGGIVFVGSSSIRMWKTLAEDFPEWQVLNRGFGGAQVPDVTYYLDRLVLPHRPRRIVFYAGDNDLGDGRSPEEVAEDFRRFVQDARQALPGVRVSFLSIKPSPAREALQEKIDAANRIIRAWIATTSDVSYVDVATPMQDALGRAKPELFAPDGLHLGTNGYRLWREVVGAHLRNAMHGD